MNIRMAEEKDLKEWLNLWKGYQDFYQINLSEEATENTWKAILDTQSSVSSAVAINEQGKMVGLVTFIFHPNTWTIGDNCYLKDLFVEPEFRGKKVGRGLIEFVKVQATEKKCTRLYWLTHKDNQEGIALYDKVATNAGFIQYRINLDRS